MPSRPRRQRRSSPTASSNIFRIGKIFSWRCLGLPPKAAYSGSRYQTDGTIAPIMCGPFPRRSFDMFCSNVYVRDDAFRRVRTADWTAREVYFTLQELGFYWIKRDVWRNHRFPFGYHIKKYLGTRIFRFLERHAGRPGDLFFVLVRNEIPYRKE